MAASTTDKIIETAESLVRAGGYNAFSFREISKQIGIKSASIHYHFPTKADLGVAVANRYTERFMAQLDAQLQSGRTQAELLQLYIAQFRHSLKVEKKMCLCGVLASETDALPEPLQLSARRFFELNLAWLSRNVFARDSEPDAKSALAIASLEGALLLSKALDSVTVFDQVAAQLRLLCNEQQ